MTCSHTPDFLRRSDVILSEQHIRQTPRIVWYIDTQFSNATCLFRLQVGNSHLLRESTQISRTRSHSKASKPEPSCMRLPDRSTSIALASGAVILLLGIYLVQSDLTSTLTNYLAIQPATTGNKPSTSSTMAWRSSGRTNAELISNLYKSQLITSDRVRASMTSVDRAHYAPAAPYEDSPQTIGYQATISAPHMHASASESLLPFMPENKGAKVLDVGSGSGYLTHVLANLVCGADGKGDGKVVGIDHIPQLTELATSNMRKSEEGRRLLESGKVEFVTGDGRKGYVEGGPYDAIHVGAAASEMHPVLIEQLRAPGRMFIPVEDAEDRGMFGAQYIWVVDKDEKGEVKRKRDMGVRYVMLTDAPK